jgi:hypothetical protein
MTLIVLCLLGLMVVVVTVAPPDSAVRGGHSPSPTPAPQSAQLSNPDGFDVKAKLSANPGAAEKTVEAEVGDRVLLTVDGSRPDSVALDDMEVHSVERDSPARFELLADTPGHYPLVLVDEGRRIGTLEVR